MIETKKLLLRQLHESDFPTLVRELNNYNITRNTGRVPYPYSLQDAVDYLQFVKGLSSKSCVRALTRPSSPEKLLGVVAYLFSAEKDDAELGYWLIESEWGKGLMSEAVGAMVGHAFGVTNIEKLIATFQIENPASGRVLQKAGFNEIGQSMNFSKAQGKEVAVTNMTLTKEMWQSKTLS
jgi:[ribosomal protein S5]-alanine N-acetyltransferase